MFYYLFNTILHLLFSRNVHFLVISYCLQVGKTDDEINKSIEESWNDTEKCVTNESNEKYV